MLDLCFYPKYIVGGGGCGCGDGRVMSANNKCCLHCHVCVIYVVSSIEKKIVGVGVRLGCHAG